MQPRDNLPWVLENGLCCGNHAVRASNLVTIGNLELTSKRATHPMQQRQGGRLRDWSTFSASKCATCATLMRFKWCSSFSRTPAGATEGPRKAMYAWFERCTAQVPARAPVPHHQQPIWFGYRMVSDRGIAKNRARAKVRAALANLHVARRRLMTQGVRVSAVSASAKIGP